MNCKLNRNILKSTSCGYSLQEIVAIYLANFDELTQAEPDVDSGGCESIVTISSGTTWYKIEPSKNSASFTDTLVVADNGTKYRTHSLTFTTPGVYDACAHVDMDNLSLGKYVAVVKQADGIYLMLGRVAGLEASAAELSGGNDGSGATYTLDGNAAESAIPLADAAVETLLAHVAE